MPQRKNDNPYDPGTDEYKKWNEVYERLGRPKVQAHVDQVKMYVQTFCRMERVGEILDTAILVGDGEKDLKVLVDIQGKLSKDVLALEKHIGISEHVDKQDSTDKPATREDIEDVLDE